MRELWSRWGSKYYGRRGEISIGIAKETEKGRRLYAEGVRTTGLGACSGFGPRFCLLITKLLHSQLNSA